MHNSMESGTLSPLYLSDSEERDGSDRSRVGKAKHRWECSELLEVLEGVMDWGRAETSHYEIGWGWIDSV